MIGGLYYSEAWPTIVQGIAELRDGRPDTIVRLLQLLSGPDDGGRLSNFAEAAYDIVCMDEERLTVPQAEAFRGRIYAAAPFADPGRGVEGARDSCEAWPAPPEPTYPFPARVEGFPPTLVVSITGDPATLPVVVTGRTGSVRTMSREDGDGHERAVAARMVADAGRVQAGR